MTTFQKSIFLTTFCLFISCNYCREPKVEPISIYEQDEEYSGGKIGTTFDNTQNAFGNMISSLTNTEQDLFAVGNSFFRDPWTIAPGSVPSRDGLGPFLNATSCGGCHQKDGRAKPPIDPSEKPLGLLFRLSINGQGIHGEPLNDPNYGGQLNNNSISGVQAEGDIFITYVPVYGSYSDGQSYNLQKPTYNQQLNYGSFASDIQISPRIAMQIPGLGLLEAVDESTILSFADPNDSNQDGISGKANYVWSEEKQQTVLGRFGWKANQPSLNQQVAGAFLGDIGITSSLFPNENLIGNQITLYGSLPTGGTPELTNDKLQAVIFYQQTLAIPARRNAQDQTVLKGKQLFLDAKCSSCHIPKMQTSLTPNISYYTNQTIRPFTDLLLHDMGPDLADNRPDFLANGREWRTAPLWGIGLVRTVNGHDNLLHDGRARGFTEAILWHGGEAEKSREKFKNLSKSDRESLIKFLESL